MLGLATIPFFSPFLLVVFLSAAPFAEMGTFVTNRNVLDISLEIFGV